MTRSQSSCVWVIRSRSASARELSRFPWIAPRSGSPPLRLQLDKLFSGLDARPPAGAIECNSHLRRPVIELDADASVRRNRATVLRLRRPLGRLCRDPEAHAQDQRSIPNVCCAQRQQSWFVRQRREKHLHDIEQEQSPRSRSDVVETASFPDLGQQHKAVSEQGVRLHIRKDTLRGWRREFARHLREQGISANATERAVRGEVESRKTDGFYRAALRGDSKHMRTRVDVAVADIAKGRVPVESGKETREA